MIDFRNRLGRFTCLCSSVLWMLPLFGQVDTNVMRAKYGPPVEEVFTIRPGITVTVAYGDNQQVCKLDIRPSRNASVISATLIQQVVDEMVPPLSRGNPGRQSVSCAGASCWKMAEYEKFSIGQAAGDVTPNPDSQTQNSLATVQFKSCQPLKQ